MVTAPLHVLLRRTGDPRLIRTGVSTKTVGASATELEVDVDGQGGVVTVPFLGGTKANERPAAGDVVVLQRSGGLLVCTGIVGGTVVVPPAPEPDEPDTNPPPPPPTSTTITLTPTATGSARAGSVRPDTDTLNQGDWTGRGVQFGQAVYKARRSGTCTRARLQVRRLNSGYFSPQTPTWCLLNGASLSGSPSIRGVPFTGGALTIGATTTIALPNSWGQSLIDGSAGGLGIYVSGSSPYITLAGKNAGMMKLTLTIRSA